MNKLFILGTLCLLFTITAVSQSKKDWEKVQSLNSWNAYQQFINNYPNGKYTAEAKQKQALLEQPAPVNKVEENKVATEVPVEKSIAPASADSIKNGSPIILKKKRYYVDEKPLTNKELKNILKSDPESAIVYKKSKNLATAGYITAGVAAFGLTFVAGPLVGVVGGFALSLPFIIPAVKKQKEAIEIYNSKRTVNTAPELKE